MLTWVKLAASEVLDHTRALDVWERRRGEGAAILSYHRVLRAGDAYPRRQMAVSADLFDAQMAYVARAYRVVSLGDVPALLASGSPIPPRTVAITFDDGYADNYDVAFPALRRYGLPATVFLATDFIGTGALLWWDELIGALTDGRRPGDGNGRPSAHLPEGVAGLLGAIDRRDARRRGRLVSELITVVNGLDAVGRRTLLDAIREPGRARAGLRPATMLSWDQVREMAAGGVSFGAHTCSHAFLDELGDEELAREILESKRRIEAETGTVVEAFSYPKGRASARAKDLVARTFRVACTTAVGLNGRGADPHLLRRIDVGECRGIRGRFSASWFSLQLSGLKERMWRAEPPVPTSVMRGA